MALIAHSMKVHSGPSQVRSSRDCKLAHGHFKKRFLAVNKDLKNEEQYREDLEDGLHLEQCHGQMILESCLNH